MGFRIWGLGFRVCVWGFRIWGFGFRVRGLGLGFRRRSGTMVVKGVRALCGDSENPLMIRTKISAAVQWLIVGVFGGDVHGSSWTMFLDNDFDN